MAIAGTGLEVIVSGFAASFLAQGLKVFWYKAKNKPVNFRILTATGGMPSSHSAGMTGMATSVGLVSGFTSVDFAVSVGIASIVMYDAAGVRRSAGRMAGVLNQLTKDLAMHHPELVPSRLKDLLGHTPYEVLVGGLLGIVLAYAFHLGL